MSAQSAITKARAGSDAARIAAHGMYITQYALSAVTIAESSL